MLRCPSIIFAVIHAENRITFSREGACSFENADNLRRPPAAARDYELMPPKLPRPMRSGRHQSDLNLVAAVMAGDARAREKFTRAIADVVWSSCRLVTTSPADAEQAFAEIMDAVHDGSYRRLKPYDGRYPLSTFVVMVVREALSMRTLNLLALEKDRGWRAIERFFQSDIRRIIHQRLPASAQPQFADDAYQAICLALVDNDFRRLRLFSGTGSFTGFVLHTVERLAIDYARSLFSRRRLPVAVMKLSRLDQLVFRGVYWDREEPKSAQFPETLSRRLGTPVSAAEVSTAIERLRLCLPAGFESGLPSGYKTVPMEDLDNHAAGADNTDGPAITPETEILEREAEELLEAALSALRSACSGLSESEALFLRHLLSGLPPRQIAPLMGLAVAEVNQLRQRIIRYLIHELKGHDAVKNWLASVYV